jgi:hypothetical protein
MSKTTPNVISYIRLWETAEMATKRMGEVWQKLSSEERRQALKMTRTMSYDDLPPLEMYDSDEVTDVDVVVPKPPIRKAG